MKKNVIPEPVLDTREKRIENEKALVTAFETLRPKTEAEARRLVKEYGCTLRYMKSGAYRRVFHITGTELVLKIATEEYSYDPGTDHSKTELRTIKRMKKEAKFKPLRQFIPEVFYGSRNGRLIVMRKYTQSRGAAFQEVSRMIQEMVRDVLDDDCDIDSRNIGFSWEEDNWGDPVKQYKFIDLGLF